MPSGLTPPRVHTVKPYRYTVQPGDDLGTITGLFGMPVGRWPELCGANLHKALSDEPPEGWKHRCFRELRVGEELTIPGHWASPYGFVGAIEIPASDVLDAFIKTMQQFLAKFPQFGAFTENIAAVVYSWWPWLSKLRPGQGIPTTPPATYTTLENVLTTTLTQVDWALLFKSANDFLTTTGIGQAKLPTVQAVPWGDIPWTQMAGVWNQVQPQVWSNLTTMLASLTGQQIPPHTTQPILHSTSNQLAGEVPNFFDPTIWSSPTYKSVPFANLKWDQVVAEVMKDPRFAKCSMENPSRLAELQKCTHCFSNATEFVDRLCTTDANPCHCPGIADKDGGEGEPTTPAVVKPPEQQEQGMSSFTKIAIGITAVLGVMVVVTSLPEGK